MDIKELDDVERYLVKQGEMVQLCNLGGKQTGHLTYWLRDRFAELRAREEAKGGE